MLVEIAAADGDLEEEEVEFIADFVPEGMGTVEEIAAKDKLNAIELGETAAGETRETMLMVAWAVALTDEELESEEEVRLAEFATGLEIADDKVSELKLQAQEFILEQALNAAYDGGSVEGAMKMAQQIGLSDEDALRLHIRYKKRNGIF